MHKLGVSYLLLGLKPVLCLLSGNTMTGTNGETRKEMRQEERQERREERTRTNTAATNNNSKSPMLLGHVFCLWGARGPCKYIGSLKIPHLHVGTA